MEDLMKEIPGRIRSRPNHFTGFDAFRRVLNSGVDIIMLCTPPGYRPEHFEAAICSIIALSKDNLKACLAYSTVSQLSYVILGVALLTPSGIEGGLVHIANHAFSKITLFFCAGAIYVATHKKDISQMSGLGHVMPLTFSAFAVASLSMIGVPPVAGFVSKWYLVIGSLEATPDRPSRGSSGQYAAQCRVLRSGDLPGLFWKTCPSRQRPEGGISRHGYPLLITAAISFAIGIFPGFFMSFVKGVLQ